MSNDASAVRQQVTINGVTLTDTYLHMIRESLTDLPLWMADCALPPGYRFRMFRPSDAGAWVDLHRVAEPFLDIKDDMFEQQFGGEEDALPERMFMIETDAGELVGSATAWWKADWHGHTNWGKVHWVVVHPNHQGRGLSKPLMAQVMQQLRQNHQRAQLGTSTGRVWAIKVYLDCGFMPAPHELADPTIYHAWRDVQRILEHPILNEWLT